MALKYALRPSQISSTAPFLHTHAHTHTHTHTVVIDMFKQVSAIA